MKVSYRSAVLGLIHDTGTDIDVVCVIQFESGCTLKNGTLSHCKLCHIISQYCTVSSIDKVHIVEYVAAKYSVSINDIIREKSVRVDILNYGVGQGKTIHRCDSIQAVLQVQPSSRHKTAHVYATTAAVRHSDISYRKQGRFDHKSTRLNWIC